MKTICSWRLTRKSHKKPNTRKLAILAEKAAVLAGAGLEDKVLSLSFVSPEEMAEINEGFVGHTGPTDVICFDYRESDCDSGDICTDDGESDDGNASVDIIICPAVASNEAGKRGLPYSREVILYIVHGLLHASGEDDLVPAAKRRMRRREKTVLSALEKEFVFSDIFP